MSDVKRKVRAAFEAAHRYEEHADVQRRVAVRLADHIAALPLAPAPRVLEVGCGTGFLAEAVGDRLGEADWLMTDIAPAMVERSRRRFAGTRFRFALLDAEAPQFDPSEAPFDLICSNLTLQWLQDREGALLRLFRHLRPGGRLLFSTLVEGTLEEWQAAHRGLGFEAGTPPFPSAADYAALRLDGVAAHVTVERFVQASPDAISFLRALRAIGAGTPRPRHRPLPPSALRAVMRRFEAGGAEASYKVAFCAFSRPDDIR